MEAGPPPRDEATSTRNVSLSGPIRRMATGAGLFLSICLVATLGYMAAGWSVDDAVYMVVITIFGVGFGEVQPVDSRALRILTMLLISLGYCAVVYTVGGFIQMLIDGEITKALEARRMTTKISQLEKHTIVCGVGRMGSNLVRELAALGRPFVVVDVDERRLQAAEAHGCMTVHGDASEEHVLEQAGIARASVLATVLSQDAANVFVAITARAMNPSIMIIARAEDPRTEKKLLVSGANKVVLPTAIGAKKLAQMISRPTAENMLEQLTQKSDMNDELARIGLHFDELAVAADSALVNTDLRDIELKNKHGFVIVGIRQADGSVLIDPPPGVKLTAGDRVIVLGHGRDLPQLQEKFSAGKKKITYRGVRE